MPRYGDFEYSRVNSGISIDKYTGSVSKVTIPEKIIGLPVTFIGKAAFRDCHKLTSIEIPDGVTSIGILAFFHCSSLRSITILDTWTEEDLVRIDGCAGADKTIFARAIGNQAGADKTIFARAIGNQAGAGSQAGVHKTIFEFARKVGGLEK